MNSSLSTPHPIIAIHGFKQSGKDTLAKLLVDEFGYTRIAFADRVKDAIHLIFGVSKELLYGSDEDKQQLSPVRWSDVEKVPERKKDDPTFLSIRELLQIFATEMCRDKIPSVWYRYLPIDPQRPTVISDLRFENEAQHLQSLGAVIIRVQRPQAKASSHASEMGIPEAYIHHNILNNKDLDHFLNLGRALCRELNIPEENCS
jgi:hypothetical protein